MYSGEEASNPITVDGRTVLKPETLRAIHDGVGDRQEFCELDS